MDQNHWNDVNRIFHAALEVDPSERQSFVAAESNGNAMIQEEVEMLLKADAAAGSYLEAPLFPEESFPSPSLLAPGDVLCGRFRIVREIAEGGMGHVFEAFDTELAVPIALKLVRAEIASDPSVIARFRQEVRLARSITHPNICRTFDLEREIRVLRGRSTELVFLTMEFLAGETLSARIQRNGALSPEDVLSFARQIAAALHAAHSLGIIHRDMKPTNIMLVAPNPPSSGSSRAIVTDFGLARLDPFLLQFDEPAGSFSSLTHAGRPIGTLSYMAPEQLEGTPVSPATDIYAFGLTLFEMVSGQRAFPAGNLLSGIAQRLRGSTDLEQRLPVGTPAAWRNAIHACLQVQPADRPQDAEDVLDILEGRGRRLSRLDNFRQQWLDTRSRSFVVGGVLLAAMAFFAATLRLYQWRTNSTVVPGALVYLAPVRNETGEKPLDNVTELVQAGLEQSAHINLLDAAKVGDILQQMTKQSDAAIDYSTAREIAMRAGAARVIFPSLTFSGGNYHLNIEIQQTDDSPFRFRKDSTQSWNWRSTPASVSSHTISPDLLKAVREASGWIRYSVGESRGDIARLDVPPSDVTTGNWQALGEYATGEKFATAGKPEDAILAFRNAVVDDPDFALAYAREGDLLLSINKWVEGFDAYDHALSTDLDHRLTRKERDFIKGAYANDTCDYASGEAAFRDYAAYYENDYLGVFFRAYPLRMMGRFKEAVSVLKRAHELSPKSGGPYMGLTYNYMLLRDFAAAHASIDGLQELGRRDNAAMLGGHLAMLEGQPQDAAVLFASLANSNAADQRSLGYALRARLAAEYGKYEDAIRELGAGIENDRSRGDREPESSKLLDRAYLTCHTNDQPSCLADVRNAVDLTARPDNLVRASALLGREIANPQVSPAFRAALTAQLEGLTAKLPAQDDRVIFQLARIRIHAEVLLARRRPREAVIELRKADSLDSSITDREYLARALIAAASSSRSGAEAESLLAEALALRERIAMNPQLVWNFCPLYPPGFQADEMKGYLDLAARLHRSGDAVQQVQTAYEKFRG